ncbi:Histidine kinase-, DNA gyrase B-, and HSP90-like ATPase [Butyrivibrio proteoclasticus]|uniref:Histidine kinase-, DNA gyrase B-, and HSP90-like ATPase n=1 Tax=Butyrivibrio proteoclasticus TaxID=43305 RepID=A0A1I5VF79_9FIRM|nr:histidine kinase [Butyrivibrio proteoclasticus]SFQ06140.1 Histidine kinase-, DNA gyrase B-, and HSP90-like ATPase [Butyrivibrio proteoclasticus]
MKKTALQKWLRRYWVLTALFFVVLFLFLHITLVRSVTTRTEKNIRKSIAVSAEGIEKSLQMVDGFVNEGLYSNTTQQASHLYYELRSESNPVSLMSARTSVLSSLQSIVTWSPMIDYIMLYTDRLDDYKWLEVGSGESVLVRDRIMSRWSKDLEKGEDKSIRRYMIWPDEEGNQMLRILKVSGSYLIVGVSRKEIISTLQAASFDDESIVFAADKGGRLIFSSSPIECVVDPENEGTYITVNGSKYLQTGYLSDQSGYYFGTLTNRSSILKDTLSFDIIYAFVSLIIIILIPISMLLIRRNIENPIEMIADTMNEISEGDLEAQVDSEFKIKELDILVKSFNHMINRIGALKIEKYEMELEAQKATMQYLQQQTKPHFYANVLNIIYSLAERKDFETIQRMSKAIVNYSRYMFKDTRELVELEKELEHLSYYMEIQEIRYMKQIDVAVDIPENLRSCLVPPFIILTFVENSVKYAFSTQKNCRISVAAFADDKKEYLTLRIKDNGAGYPERILACSFDELSEDGHVGLNNINQRLKLIFDDKASVEMKNEDGAVTIIRIPCIVIEDSFEEDF